MQSLTPKPPARGAAPQAASVRKPASRTAAASRFKARPKRKLSHTAALRRIRLDRSWARRLTLHPTTMFALLIVGACLAGMTYKTYASDYTVTAVVAAPPLTTGAVITNPADSSVQHASLITVSGTCPDEGYVKLFRNSIFSGAAICDKGTFKIAVALLEGGNTLQAQSYNITDAAGPVTDVVQTRYQPAKPLAPADTAPPLLTGDYHFTRTPTDQNFMWQLQFQGGQAPYAADINWGDGKTSSQGIANNNAFTINHHYAKAGYYTIGVKAWDSRKRETSLQLAALISHPNDPPTIGAILPNGSAGAGDVSRIHWLAYIWPTYLIVAALVASFWLGERREYLLLTHKAARQALRGPRLHHT